MDERISIVVPVYNAERHIANCIRSVLRQTYSNWNLILVNDGSTDQSRKVLDEYVKKDERIYVIHQENKGAFEARKTGVLHEKVQKNPFIMFVDADDKLPNTALELLISTMKRYDVDLVCGNTKRMFRGGILPQRWTPPCFRISTPQIYIHVDIIEKLYISFFGISNFPVSLCAKIYKTEIVTKVICFDSVVKSMGEDLSVTIRILPEVRKLAIVSDTVYYYRLGGGTSRFIPHFMEDFLNLYNYKKQYAIKYPMPYDVEYYMDVELMNIVKSHFIQCIKAAVFSENEMKREIEKCCERIEVKEAASRLIEKDQGQAEYAKLVFNKDIQAIFGEAQNLVQKSKFKDKIKEIMKKF